MQVLVTGGNGHLGFNLVRTLVDAGHSVRAGVRTIGDPAKTTALRQLGAVQLVEADLAKPLQLRAAMEDVEVLFHAAAVYSTVEPGRDQEIMDAAVKGTEYALRAAAEAGVRKVVMTSSVATLPMTSPGDPPSNETQWTSAATPAYVRAKVEAEQLAWKLAGKLGLDLVTILPGAIGGPGFARGTPTTDLLEAMMLGAFRLGVPDINITYVDVRDVATAHRLAAEKDVHGRFIVASGEAPTFRRLLEVMNAIDPRIGLPLMTMPDFLWPLLPLADGCSHRLLGTPRTASSELLATMRGRRWSVDTGRARSLLGWEPKVSLEQSLRDTLAALRMLRAGP